MITENGKSYNEKAKKIIFCGIYKMEIQERSNKRPQLSNNKFKTIRNKTQQNDITEIYCVPIYKKQRTRNQHYSNVLNEKRNSNERQI